MLPIETCINGYFLNEWAHKNPSFLVLIRLFVIIAYLSVKVTGLGVVTPIKMADKPSIKESKSQPQPSIKSEKTQQAPPPTSANKSLHQLIIESGFHWDVDRRPAPKGPRGEQNVEMIKFKEMVEQAHAEDSKSKKAFWNLHRRRQLREVSVRVFTAGLVSAYHNTLFLKI